MLEQCNGGKQLYGGITSREELERNLAMHCIPQDALEKPELDYEAFLEERRRLMALKIKTWVESL